MYLWNTNALARELKEGTLSEREKFKYLLVYVVVEVILLELSNYPPYEYSEFMIPMSVFSILSVIIGTYICYRTNQNGDGVRFIERYICLGLPLSIKIVVLFIAAALLLLIVAEIVTEWPEETTFLESASLVAVTIIYYWRLNVHIKSISHNAPAVSA